MARPEFPRCIMPVRMIHRIVEEQRYYDENPEKAEREQREERERNEQEQENLRYEYRKEQER